MGEPLARVVERDAAEDVGREEGAQLEHHAVGALGGEDVVVLLAPRTAGRAGDRHRDGIGRLSGALADEVDDAIGGLVVLWLADEPIIDVIVDDLHGEIGSAIALGAIVKAAVAIPGGLEPLLLRRGHGLAIGGSGTAIDRDGGRPFC